MELVKRFFTNNHIMLVLVLINTGIIFISGFLPNQGGTLLIIDSIFSLLFLIEAFVKIHVSGFSEYWSDGWNRFDFIIVLSLKITPIPSPSATEVVSAPAARGKKWVS